MQVSGPTGGLSWRKPWLNPAPTLTQRTLHLAQRGLAGLPALQFSHRGPGETKAVHIRTPLGEIRPHPDQDAGHNRAGVVQGSPCPPPWHCCSACSGAHPTPFPLPHGEPPLPGLSPLPGGMSKQSPACPRGLSFSSARGLLAEEPLAGFSQVLAGTRSQARGQGPSVPPSEGQVHRASIWIRAPGCFGGNSPGHRRSGEALFPRE